MDTILLERPVSKEMPEWVPVIFGNGEDDDTPGIVASLTNEKVQVGDVIFAPGEDVYVENMHIIIKCHLTIINEKGRLEFFGSGPEVTVRPAPGRTTHFSDCTLEAR